MILIHYILPLILFAGFGFLHSYAAKIKVKDLFQSKFPGMFSYYRLIYNVGSLLYFLLFLWSLPGKNSVLYTITFPWIILFIFLVCCGFWIAWRSFHHFDTLAFLGIRQIANPGEVNDYGEYDEKLSSSGWYHYVRHPLYFGSLLIIWSWPFMTFSWLQMAVYVTIYFVIGSRHEEKILLNRYGDSYRNYQKRTKRIVPFIY